MNDKKICFIICTNNKLLLDECIEYISRLYVPENYEIELLTIMEASSMTSGYNEGMRSSDAKYKVYMHQDVFIFNRYFIYDLLKIFNNDEKIGAIGMVGYPNVSADGIMWHERRVGALPLYGVSEHYKDDFKSYRYDLDTDGYNNVKVADGLLLATRIDVDWDEEFDGWDFYDATQCLRIINAGYKVVVPNQKVPWFVHDDGKYLSVWKYNYYRRMFLTKYKNYIQQDEKKIAFITCVNNEDYYNECLWYLKQLIIPKNFSVEYIPIRNAKSMVKGYSYGQNSSNAKYKIYIHQDTFITEKDFIIELLKLFNDNKPVGLVGIIGADYLCHDAIIWDKWNYGRTIAFDGYKTFDLVASADYSIRNHDIKVIDGMLMATQYDVAWREDLNLGWDFYDVTQSIEYNSHGYKIGLMPTGKSYVLHDCGPSKLLTYDLARKIVLEEYSWTFKSKCVPQRYTDEAQFSQKFFDLILTMIESKNYSELEKALKEMFSERANWWNLNIRLARLLYDIFIEEEKCSKFTFLNTSLKWSEIVDRFNRIKFALRRVWYNDSIENIKMAKDTITKEECSEVALRRMICVAVPQKDQRRVALEVINQK